MSARVDFDVGTYLRSTSVFGVYMPVIFSIRLVIFTVLLFVYHIAETLPFYFLCFLQLAYVVIFVFFGEPHLRFLDFLRAMWIELGLFLVFLLRFLEIKVFAENFVPESQIYPIIAYI